MLCITQKSSKHKINQKLKTTPTGFLFFYLNFWNEFVFVIFFFLREIHFCFIVVQIFRCELEYSVIFAKSVNRILDRSFFSPKQFYSLVLCVVSPNWSVYSCESVRFLNWQKKIKIYEKNKDLFIYERTRS